MVGDKRDVIPVAVHGHEVGMAVHGHEEYFGLVEIFSN